MLIDVRESPEFAVSGDLYTQLPRAPHNVPLSRFVNFALTLFAKKERPKQAFIFLCSNGTRSQCAAKSLARLGIPCVSNLEGGLALL